MTRLFGFRVITAVLASSLALGSVLTPSPVQAATQGCQPKIGKRLPIIMVHGFNDNTNVWTKGKSSMKDTLIAVNNVYLDKLFDYSSNNKKWVDNQNIGPRLAERITCIAQSSREAGGPGKVVVIGHSMGGLAARFAANYTLNNGHRVADDMGLMVTIGTPHLGSDLADIGSQALRALCFGDFGNQPKAEQKQVEADLKECFNKAGYLSAVYGLRPDSTRLRNLKPFPPDIPVHAIAGNVGQFNVNIFDNQLKFGDSDKVVTGKSATQESAHKEAGGGVSVIQCAGVDPIMSFGSLLKSDASCEHSNLTKDRQVQNVVLDSIRQYKHYLDKINPPIQWFRFDRLEIPLSKGWKIEESSPAEPKVTLANTLSRCMGRDYDCQKLIFIHPSRGDGNWATYPVCYKEDASKDEWGAYADHPLVYKDLFSIGTHRAAYYQQDFCFDYAPRVSHFANNTPAGLLYLH